jgi:hypothetical protein
MKLSREPWWDRGNKAPKARRRSGVGRHRTRPRGLERLEDRIVLNGGQIAQAVVQQLVTDQGTLNGLVEDAAKLPFIGSSLSAYSSFSTLFQDSEQRLETAIDNTGQGPTQFELSFPLVELDPSLRFNLGLGSFLNLEGSIDVSIEPTLNVGFTCDPDTGTASLDSGSPSLDIRVQAGLSNFQGSFSLDGFLFTTVNDEGSNFTGDLNFGFPDGGSGTFDLSATTNLRMALDLHFADPSKGDSFNPEFKADLALDWTFDANNTGQPASDSLSGAFNNFRIETGPTFGALIGGLAAKVQQFSQPLQPIANFLNTPVPIISDFGIHKHFSDLLTSQANVPGGLNTFLQAYNVINSISPDDPEIILGSFTFGDVRTDDTIEPPAFLGNVLGQKNIDAIEKAFNQSVEDSGGGFHFPLLEDPAEVIPQLLTGQDVKLVTYQTPQLQLGLDATLGFNVAGLFGAGLEGKVEVDAGLSIGYDTHGLIQFATSGFNQPGLLADGFYIDDDPNQTYLNMNVSLTLFAAAGVKVSGSIDGGVAVTLHGTPSGTVHFDELKSPDPTCIFDVKGTVTALGSIALEIDIPPVGPDITVFSYDFANVTLLNLCTTCDSNPQGSLPDDRVLEIPVTTASDTIVVQPYMTVDQPIVEDDVETGQWWRLGIEVNANGAVTRYGLFKYFRYFPNEEPPEFAPGWYYDDPDTLVAVGGSIDPTYDFTLIHSNGGDPNVEGGNDEIVVRTTLPQDTPDEQGLAALYATEPLPFDYFNQIPVYLNAGPNGDHLEYDGTGSATIYGGSGSDVLIGSPASTLVGDGGQDILKGAAYEWAGDPFVAQTQPNPADSSVLIGAGAAIGPDGVEEEFLHGDDGNDTIYTGAAPYVNVSGGLGDDTMVVQGQPTPTAVWADGGAESNTLEVKGTAEELFVPPTTQDTWNVAYSGLNLLGTTVTTTGGINNLSVNALNVQSIGLYPGETASRVNIGDLSNSGVTGVSVNLLDVYQDPGLASRGRAAQTVEVQGTSGSDQLTVDQALQPSGEAAAVISEQSLNIGSDLDIGVGGPEWAVSVLGLCLGDNLVLDGGDGSDSYLVRSYPQMSYSTFVFDSGSTGSDSVDVDTSELGAGLSPGKLRVYSSSVYYTYDPYIDYGSSGGTTSFPVSTSVAVFFSGVEGVSFFLPDEPGGNDATLEQTQGAPDTTIFGSSGPDRITATADSNTVTLDGDGGDDTLTFSGLASFVVDGGPGNDTYNIDLPNDFILYPLFDNYQVSDSGPDTDTDQLNIVDTTTGTAGIVTYDLAPGETDVRYLPPVGVDGIASEATVDYSKIEQVVVDGTVDASQSAYWTLGDGSLHPPTSDSLSLLEILGGDGPSFFNVVDTRGITTTIVDPGTGPSFVTAGSSQQNMDHVDNLTVSGGGATFLTLDDQDNQHTSGSSPVFDVTGWSVTRRTSAISTTIFYDNVVSLELDGGSGGNQIIVEGTSVPTSINAGAGDDTIDVGNVAGQLVDLLAALSINGQGGTNTLNFNDQGALQTEVIDVYQDKVVRYDGSTPIETVTYTGVRNFALSTGTSRDFIGVGSTLPGTTYDLDGGGAEDEFIVEDDSSLDGIQGPLHLHEPSTGPMLAVISFSDGLNTEGHNYTFNGGSLSRKNLSGQTDMATVTWDNPAGGTHAEVVLYTGPIYSGHGNNRVNVQSTGAALTAIDVQTGDIVTIGSVAPSRGGTMAGIAGEVAVLTPSGAASPTVVLDDAGNTSTSALPRDIDLGGGPNSTYEVTGLAPAPIELLMSAAAQVSIKTGATNDVIRVHDFTDAPAMTIDAGRGTNTLDYSAYTGTVRAIMPLGIYTGFAGITNIQNVSGGIGNSLLIGDARANGLKGGTGRNVIIGGGGGDTFDASAATSDNMLISGTTDYDDRLAALDAIFAEWTRTDLSYNNRYRDLVDGSGSRNPLNKVKGRLIFLTADTVHGDGKADTLTGTTQTDPSTGRRAHNWFFDEDGIDTLINYDPSSDHKTKIKRN